MILTARMRMLAHYRWTSTLILLVSGSYLLVAQPVGTIDSIELDQNHGSVSEGYWTASLNEFPVRGKNEQVPSRVLRWDGAPPRAWIESEGRVIAPPVLSIDALAWNARGVAWDRNGLHVAFPVEREIPSLTLKLERFPHRAPLLLACCALGISLVTTLALWTRHFRGKTSIRGVVFPALAVLSGLSFFPGFPLIPMSSDSANINSFAAALDDPGEFQADPLLSDPSNFAWYTPVYVSVVRWFGAKGWHFDTNRAALSVATTVIALFGYELLFRRLSGNRLFAFVAAISIWFLKENYPPNETWSATHVLPRTVFSSLLPWVMLLTWRVLDFPKLWFVPAVASGLLFYIHPVSSPALSGTVLMGLLVASNQQGESLIQKLKWGCLAGISTLGVMLPYGLIYARKYEGTLVQDPELLSLAMEATRARLAPGFLDPSIFLGQVATFLVWRPHFWFGFALIFWLIRQHFNSGTVRLATGMTLGWIIVTFFLPIVDYSVSAALGRMPFQVDLLRGIRYIDVVLLSWLALGVSQSFSPMQGFLGRWVNQFHWLWAERKTVATNSFLNNGRLFSVPSNRRHLVVPSNGNLLPIAMMLVLVCYSTRTLPTFLKLGGMAKVNLSLLRGDFPEQISNEWEILQVVRTLRNEGDLVSSPMSWRQAGIPVALTTKDLGCLSYANPAALVEADRKIREAGELSEYPIDRRDLWKISSCLEADWIVIPSSQASTSLGQSSQIVFRNANFLLIHTPDEWRISQSPERQFQ